VRTSVGAATTAGAAAVVGTTTSVFAGAALRVVLAGAAAAGAGAGAVSVFLGILFDLTAEVEEDIFNALLYFL
jgi:hypothetical protein